APVAVARTISGPTVPVSSAVSATLYQPLAISLTALVAAAKAPPFLLSVTVGVAAVTAVLSSTLDTSRKTTVGVVPLVICIAKILVVSPAACPGAGGGAGPLPARARRWERAAPADSRGRSRACHPL